MRRHEAHHRAEAVFGVGALAGAWAEVNLVVGVEGCVDLSGVEVGVDQTGARLINTYLNTGKVDTSLYTHNKVDFSPSSSQGAYAEDGLGAMMGPSCSSRSCPFLMWRRARKRGGYGRKASAMLRSVFLLVLGLGGWFIGLIQVLVALPTVPLDSELMALLSIGAHRWASAPPGPGSTATGRPGLQGSASWSR